MRSARFAAVFSTLILAPAALADDAAGLQILIDMQDPTQIAKSFCVLDSKLYSEDSQVCVAPNLRLICAPVDAVDKTKGFKWTVAEEEKTPRCK
mgnify:CR=1 FL=1